LKLTSRVEFRILLQISIVELLFWLQYYLVGPEKPSRWKGQAECPTVFHSLVAEELKLRGY
jgi:hypothetical protein